MDHPDEKTADFERRTSRRMSRQVSIHASTDMNDSANNDAYLAAMGISISDGFRPSDSTTSTSADAANADQQHTISIPAQKTPEAAQSLSSSADSHDAHLSATAGSAQETSSISNDFSSSYNSSEPSPSEQSESSYSQSPMQLSSVPVSVPETDSQEEPSTSSSTSTPSKPPPISQPTVAARGRPSSIAKPLLGSLSLSGAAAYTAGASGSRGIAGGSSQRAANVRESTASSVAPAPQQDEPYEGPSGPSFPYGMYPQNVGVTRTASVATTSLAAPSESTYTGPRGPAFPYGMYPQGTMAGVAGMPSAAAGPSTVPPSAIPVGFPGMADNYQRRIGPDGEDIADLIGPDGHTEQLPPYTRYPDEAYSRKIAAANETQQPDPLTSGPILAPSSVPVAGMFPNTVPIAVEGMATVPSASTPEAAAVPASASSSVHSLDPAHAAAVPAVPAPTLTTSAAAVAPASASIPGAGGIGLAPRNPEYDGTEEAGLPRSRYSLRSFNSDGTGPEINTAARGISEKRKPPNFIQRYGGRRILGIIPYWAICLFLTAVLIMCIIMGAVVGTFVSRHKRAQSHHDSNGPQSITVTVDATPIPTPTDLPRLPTGTFSIPLQKDESPGSCFNDTTQAQAWSCNIPFQYSMSMTINSLSPTPGGPMYNLSITSNMSATVANDVYFYGEQAPVILTPMPMQLVNDTLDLNRGPAWFKMMPYNKTVVVHETFLSVPVATATGSSNKKRNKDNAAPASIAWGEGGNPFQRKGILPAQAGDKPWVCTWPDTILEVFIYPNQNTSMYKVSLSSKYTLSSTTLAPTSSSTGGIAGVTATGLTTSATTSTGDSRPTDFPKMPPGPPPFPRVIKVEERRMAKSPQATCVQYELKDEGYGLKGEPLLDADGNIVEITIAENESGPPLFTQAKRDVFGNDVYESDGEVFDKRDSYGLSKCGCLWMVT